MKSLQESLFELNSTQTMESLFDKDLVEKDLTFGDVYKPIYVSCNNARDGFKIIENMFNMSKLRKVGKRIDLSKCVSSYTNTSHIEVIELIAGIFADFPAWNINDPNRYKGYYKEINKVFGPLARSPLWNKSIYITFYETFDGDIELTISKSTMTESVHVVIRYDEVK